VLSRWPIRYKLLLGVAMICAIVAILSFSSLRGVYAYRQLVRSLSRRAEELPAAAKLTAEVGELRFAHRQFTQPLSEFSSAVDRSAALTEAALDLHIFNVQAALQTYQQILERGEPADTFIGDRKPERETVAAIEQHLSRISQQISDHHWYLDKAGNEALSDDLDRLSDLSLQLPKYLQTRMQMLRDEVRGEYRVWLVASWVATGLTLVILLLLARFFWRWVFQPMGILVAGSRRVAAGDFDHRIHLESFDEVAELADAMNAMTNRFQQIRDDLDQQVKERTKQVVRSEQLASVGFLAAGVAHEINNPMASIAWSAESLESRLPEIFPVEEADEEQVTEIQDMRQYLRRIQDEAFRCKGITERLLDFSRMGDRERQDTNLNELIESVIEMVKHLGKYRNKSIEFQSDQYVVLPVNAQEIKQVVLNLLTNALDSLDEYGQVTLKLDQTDDLVQLTVRDNGCGMTEQVREHVFEPFFTRRRGGQGIGLGLSITYRIISDHDGEIQAESDGPGCGSTFKVILPRHHHEKEEQRQHEAA
jgi:two-component system NtrC family sensor kinase